MFQMFGSRSEATIGFAIEGCCWAKKWLAPPNLVAGSEPSGLQGKAYGLSLVMKCSVKIKKMPPAKRRMLALAGDLGPR